ncbi:MAG: UDP-N-acetylmuramate dehydrogenase [Chitinophagales bacterium]
MKYNILHDFSLKKHNTFGIHTTAKYFLAIANTTILTQIIGQSVYQKEAKLVLGGGSNILFTKKFDGLILHSQQKGFVKLNENQKNIWIKAYSGEKWHDFVQFCIENNWGGIENLSLIPGCVGAAPIQNIGAYGVEIKDVFHSLDAIHLKTGEKRQFTAKDCQFAYRNSIFKQKLKNQYFIESITLKLDKQPTFQLKYGAIQKVLDEMNVSQLSVKNISRAICHIRTQKLPNPNNIGNGGSFFKNPEVSLNIFTNLQKKYGKMPHYFMDNKNIKIPAAWLIEQCGWKGKRKGNAGVYENHALVLVNYGGASGSDIYDLSSEIRDSVIQKFGILLEREVNVI